MALPKPDPNSTCVITGASSGIGREFARVLAKKGLGVTVVARRKERLDELVTEIENDFGVKAQAFACDLTDADARKKLVDDIKATGLSIDLLVNNAGFGSSGKFWKLDPDTELSQLRLNCEAVLDLSRAFLPAMVERDQGGIINTSSSGAYQPVPNMATYGATKAFVTSLSEAISSELSGTNVTITAVHPGPVPTEFPSIAGNDASFEKLPSVSLVSPEKVAEITVKAFDKGRRGVIPGMFYNILIYTSRPLPTSVKLPIVKRMFS